MGKQKRNWLKIPGIIVLILFLGFLITRFVVKSKIEDALSTKLPETLKLTYGDLNLSLMKAQIELSAIKLTNFGEALQKPNVEVELEQLTISGFRYWNLLVNDLIQIDGIYLKNPKVTYYHNPTITKDTYRVSNKESFNKHIEIKDVHMANGQLKILDSETDSLKLQMEALDLMLNRISYNEETRNRKIPIDFESYQMIFDSFFAQLNDYENVTIKHAELTNLAMELKSLRLFTKYSKETLSRIIPFERDHFNLEIESILVEQPYLEVVRDSLWLFESKKVVFYQPDFKVFRDKSVSDDVRIKPLYSKMLRDLGIDLNLENVLIYDADITYSEKVKTDKIAGTITFSKFNADIKHLSNTYKSPIKTTLNINTQFMENTPLKAVWSFDVNNKTDLFEFQADIGKLYANNLNNFTEPNLNVRLEGELDKIFFTISGTDEKSTIDFKIKYKAFDIIALKKDGKEKNKILSDIINVFVPKSSESSAQSFKEAIKHDIERHKTQSVFNFIWISTRAGLLKTMTLD